jgi:hypothetical protein
MLSLLDRTLEAHARSGQADAMTRLLRWLFRLGRSSYDHEKETPP